MDLRNKIAHLKKKLASQLEMGQEEEQEHDKTYKTIEKDVQDDGDLDMTFGDFTTDIATDHLDEDPLYYTKLKEMEKKSEAGPNLIKQVNAELEKIYNSDLNRFCELMVTLGYDCYVEDGRIFANQEGTPNPNEVNLNWFIESLADPEYDILREITSMTKKSEKLIVNHLEDRYNYGEPYYHVIVDGPSALEAFSCKTKEDAEVEVADFQPGCKILYHGYDYNQAIEIWNTYTKLKEMEKTSRKEYTDFQEWKKACQQIAVQDNEQVRFYTGKNGMTAVTDDGEIGWWSKIDKIGEVEDEDVQQRYSNLNTKTGISESIDIEPDLVTTLEFGDGEPEQAEPEPCQQIDITQSSEQIKNQLLGEVNRCFPNRLTYDSIYNTAVNTGVEKMDRYDLIGILNSVALELGLPRIGWDAYFPDNEEARTNNIQGIIGQPAYNDESTDVNEISDLFDNSPDKLFVLDRILDERIKMFMNYDDIIDQSTEVVAKSLSNIRKKSCVPIKYYYQGIKEQETDRAGRLISGKVHYSVRLRNNENLKMERTIDLELPIKMAKVEEPRTFKYNKQEFPLDTYFLNDLF